MKSVQPLVDLFPPPKDSEYIVINTTVTMLDCDFMTSVTTKGDDIVTII